MLSQVPVQGRHCSRSVGQLVTLLLQSECGGAGMLVPSNIYCFMKFRTLAHGVWLLTPKMLLLHQFLIEHAQGIDSRCCQAVSQY